jgi:hypothetical protein
MKKDYKMRSLRKFIIIQFISALTLLSASASPLRLTLTLGDYLLREGGSELIQAHGVTREALGSVQQSVQNSLNVLSPNSNFTSVDQLKTSLQGLTVEGEDIATQALLLQRLDQPASELSYNEMVETINTMIYLSNRYGPQQSALMTCTSCTHTAARQAGFDFAVDTLGSQRGSSLLEQMVPNSPRELNQYITRLMARHNLGNLRGVTREMLPAVEERSFALFLTMLDQGSAAQKAFAQEILNISTNPQNSRVELFNQDNAHSLWKILAWDMSDENLIALRRVLIETNREGSNQVSKEDAFFRVLERMHAGDEKSLEHVATLRANRCLFR